jgi:hypothetical protein
MEGLYFDLAKLLHTSSRCAPFTENNHTLFADFLSRFLHKLHWDLTPAMYSEDQLNHLATLWNARSAKEQALSKKCHDHNLFNDLFGSTSPYTDKDLDIFSFKIDHFCDHYKKSHPL